MSITSETSPPAEVIAPGQTQVVRIVVRPTKVMRLPPLVYLAGPYTKPDPVENTHRMLHLADALLDLGVVPFVPHLSMFWHLLCPRPYGEWLAYDLHLMLRCDAVLRVPGESCGADGEVRVAHRLGIPVLFAETSDVDDCVATVAEWLEALMEMRNT